MGKIWKSILGSIAGVGVFATLAIGATATSNHNIGDATQGPTQGDSTQVEEQAWEVCDGVKVTANCADEEGNKYSKYVFHEAEEEQTKEVYHAATAAKTHTVYHPAEYGTETYRECVKTTINYKNGSCALS